MEHSEQRQTITSKLGKKQQEIISKIKVSLSYLGFDFSKMGSIYLNEIMIDILQKPSLLHSISTKVIEGVANRYKKSCKSIERTIRLAIKKAFEGGTMETLYCFKINKAPTIKQMANFLFDYFVGFDYAY